MRLTFFVSPYDLLNEKSRTSIPLTIENVTLKHLGQSVEVCNEASGHYKLPVSSLITVTTSSSGKRCVWSNYAYNFNFKYVIFCFRSPVYANLGPLNSASLPATFVLRLCKPMPMCVNLVKSLQQITEVECGDMSTQQPMLSLITKNCSSGALDCANNKGLFVVSVSALLFSKRLKIFIFRLCRTNSTVIS